MTRKQNGSYARSQESIDKELATKRKNGTMNVNTPASIAKGLETKRLSKLKNSILL